MVPPIWRDEQGRRLPTRPCPKCGNEWPVGEETYHYSAWQLHAATGWDGITAPVHVVQWCGHAKEHVVWPVGPDRYRLLEVLGDAR
jgi:hypothetical protein